VTDADFVRQFEEHEIPNSQFRHRDHLRLGWWYLQNYGLEQAIRKVQDRIRSFAARNGHAYKYHATLTELWVRLIAAHAAGHAFLTFSDFVDENRELLDKKLPLRFYSVQRLYSTAAQDEWTEPDVNRLPWPANSD